MMQNFGGLQVELELACGCCGDINFYHPDDRRLMRWVSGDPALAQTLETRCSLAEYRGGEKVFYTLPANALVIDLGISWEAHRKFRRETKVIGPD